MKILYVMILVLFFGLFSCSEAELKGYASDDYIQFYKSAADSTVFSFAYDETLEAGVVSLKLNLISPVVDRERAYTVNFLESESSAKEGVDFELPTGDQKVLANDSIAWFEVNVKRNKNLQKAVTAVFEIGESADFRPGMVSNRKARVVITNELTRPEWWNEWHEQNGLGKYSDLKYRTFMREMKVHDLTLIADGGEMDYSTMRAYVLKFKYWLQDNPTPDEDGSTMSVAMRG